ncbi:DUF4276 family protein [Sporolactobacillus terrae]|uniref:DUF4276 family protein n=1 Tax=Sporolactobacillus terrae TaxID=269673 RepID=UPI00111A08C4|nr:DUF4276 family protein [Sporolactobacillus terrae]
MVKTMTTRSLKVLIYGEGPTDIGTVDPSGTWDKGCIVKLIERINSNVQLDFISPPRKEEISHIPIIPIRGRKKFRGHGAIINKLVLYGRKKHFNYDLVIYYGDTDKEAGAKNTRLNAKKESKEAYRQAFEAFDFFQVNGIPVIPLRMLESWLLADPNSFAQAFRRHIQLPNDPEYLWGDKHNPSSNYPKHVLKRVLSQLNQVPSNITFCQIVEHMDLETLKRRCPISFSPFINCAQDKIK